MRLIHSVNVPAIGRIPRAFIRNGEIDRAFMYNQLIENGVLREDDTKQVEAAVTEVARRDLVGVADLRTRGLTVPLRNIGVTSFEYDRVAPVEPAKQSMSILAFGDNDLVRFGRTAIPVPVTMSNFQLDARMEAAGSSRGEPISLTNVEEHTRAVAEKLEDTLVNGSSIVLGANTLPGYTNFGARHQLSYSGLPWADASAVLSDAIFDVLAMRTALRNSGFSGPYILYIPQNYDGVVDDDYKAESDRTLRERLQSITGIAEIKVLPALPDDEVLLVQMSRSVVSMAVGQDISPVTWELYGGLAQSWAILAVLTFALKEAYSRAPLSQGVLPVLTTSTGIAHLA